MPSDIITLLNLHYLIRNALLYIYIQRFIILQVDN